MTWYTDPLLKNCRHIIIEDIQKEMMITHAEGDQLQNAYNYDEVIRAIDQVLAGGHICLQETLVERIADELLRNSLVKAVLVKSQKTRAYERVKSAGVEIFKVQHD